MGDHQFFKHSFSLADIHPDFEIINSLSPLFQNQNQNQNDQDSSSSAFNFHNSILPQNLENLFLNAALTPPIISSKERERERKRKANDHTDQTTCANTSSDHSGSPNTTNRGGRGKKAAKGDDEKPREVIHVRARRGQATDSHSLAERVRRGKINERLRCLQDIVPGCYKSMGMAVMLDEIINYVQSLQNQVDFLSMRLTEASSFYDFNTETDALEAMLQHLKQ